MKRNLETCVPSSRRTSPNWRQSDCDSRTRRRHPATSRLNNMKRNSQTCVPSSRQRSPNWRQSDYDSRTPRKG
ncbi:hypothetical protein BGY98DRAFT_1052976 [Russula aff. rugulosa BPL654]|nr:hypothetical protein BGY98DRAFT_1052976 [Russula aff. rugulosa BPL654]